MHNHSDFSKENDNKVEKDEEKIVQITNDGAFSFLIGKQTGEYEFDYWGKKRQIKVLPSISSKQVN